MSDINRREFIRKFFRLGLAGGLVAVGLKLGSRSTDSELGSEVCEKPSPCQQCGQFIGCTQPKALAEKKSRKIKMSVPENNPGTRNQ